jgi:hypothetical protein
MNTVWKVIGGLGLLMVLAFSGVTGKFSGKTSEEKIDAELLQTASKLNERLPMMVDAETRWDSTVGIDKTMRYNYTLINYSASNLPVQEFRGALEAKLVNNVCTTKEMQVFVKNGVTVTYAYYGNEGKEITVIAVEPSRCGA